MKPSRAHVHARFHRIPRVVYERGSKMTSYAGLVVFQALFAAIDLRGRLRRCFAHLTVEPIFGHAAVVLLLVVHLLIGFRRLRGLPCYQRDPLIQRIVGLRQLPDVSTVSRTLASVDARCIENLRCEVRELVLERVEDEDFPRVTCDFDGSVQSTSGHAEGTAVGFNKKKKGARSYYPLFCTIAQTGQFLDLHHRPGNVHDSNGANPFAAECIRAVRSACPEAQLEAREDSAFFSEANLSTLDGLDVEFTCSVPFERLPELKGYVDDRKRWQRIDRGDKTWSYFERQYKPKSWSRGYRFLFVRRRRRKQHKGPLQLDLFRPAEFDFEYKVVVTNKTDPARTVLFFHNGRGGQEKIFGEAKQHAALDVVLGKRRLANQVFTLAGMLAHNLARELQMRTSPRIHDGGDKRSPAWVFRALGTLRQRLLHQAGRITRPQGRLTLTLADNPGVEQELSRYLGALEDAA